MGRQDSGTPGAADQQQQHNTPATATTPANATDQQKARSRGPRRQDPTVIATKEVVGRQIAVWVDAAMEWLKATIVQYNPDTNQHLIRFLDREEGTVKHEEKWHQLTKIRFQWLTPPPPLPPPTLPTSPPPPRVMMLWGTRCECIGLV